MKIKHNIDISRHYEDTDYGQWYNTNANFEWDPTKLTGVTEIKFEIVAKKVGVAHYTDVQLYDYTNNEIIATLRANSSTWTKYASADIKDSLTEAKTIGVRLGGDREGYEDFYYCYKTILAIKQDFGESTDRRSITIHPLLREVLDAGIGWIIDTSYATIPRVQNLGGAVSKKFVAVMKADAGATAQCRLWDATAAEVVSGSAIQTTSASYVFVESSELTLDDTHRYYAQFQSDSDENYANLGWAYFKFEYSGFTTFPAQLLNLGYVNPTKGAGFYNEHLPEALLTSEIEGDSIVYQRTLTGYLNKTEPQASRDIQLYNTSDASAVSGTDQVVSGTGVIYFGFRDEFDDPIQEDSFSEQQNQTYTGFIKFEMIIAEVTEAFIGGAYINPDVSQPTGYHCFMSQFIRNSIAGYIPLLTPDCVNRAW